MVTHSGRYIAKKYKASIAKQAYKRKINKTKRSINKFKRTANRLKSIRVKNSGLTSTFHKYYKSNNSIIAKKMLAKYKNGARNIQNINQNAVLALTQNKQALVQMLFGRVADFKSALVAVGLGTGSVGSVGNTARSFFTKVTGEYYMTNSSNAPVFMDIYKFICKHDCSDDPNMLFVNGLKDETAQTAIDYSVNYGVSPLDSVALNTFWRCEEITHCYLNPGQSHVERFDVHFNYSMQNEFLTSSNQLDLYLKGLTHCYLVLARGSPASSSVSPLTTISTTASNIIIAGNQRLEFKYILDEDTNYIYSQQGQTITGTAVIYNQGSGASGTNTAI